MELRQIKYFMEVAKEEHVTEAAHRLHVAQSAVSRQIAKLEDELGVELFLREGRNVKLTHAGKIFLQHMESAMNEIDRAVAAIDSYLNPEIGKIRLGFPNSLATKTLPRVISAFRSQYSDIGFDFHQGANKELRELVERGEIDLAFVSPVPESTPEISTEVFFSESMRVLLPIQHRLAKKDSVNLRELMNDQFVLFRTGYDMRSLVIEACRQVSFEPKVGFESDDVYTMKGLVEAGLGVSLLPETLLAEQTPPGTVSLPIGVPQVTRTVGVIVTNVRTLPPSEKLFYDFLISYYRRLNQFSL
ncbi:LysR family transcriptional regulator [Pseudobacillus badius]|uniref:LysR family transcriptional regulator n=1 Tax=Bacillus badius TaxID=1455 RepID=UPI0007B0507C|nr:LysR family transcriptional regulator [Bacillus badius]KZN98104.1 LysR family transcriptional regulator [Bacillus badius]MED0665365.1 LysR family transcriptional regulator [Bacillus badius]OCS82368.1 LysR family transcriptional regulator [Bacillus badius]OVE50987.1 LysR family transcriptional regulator [Bacillus badius]TDW01797.1 LysR family transcriptional activator of glutamate synthase operon [Bacillus badius]